MKLVYLLLILSIISSCFASNNYQCNKHDPNNYCSSIEIDQKVIGTWSAHERGGQTYTQYDVYVRNNLSFDVKQVYIYSDYTLRLKDRRSIWNIDQNEETHYLTLPSYQSSIGPHSFFVFGMILQGKEQANLTLDQISF
ncbi:hypothetical protein DICPUDRAFT_77419 [Dictyostelium purpureum]|uniref:Carbohydrate binding domain-containing protein n=1 Tax=Dictyostelium purpureum TaxID=5786 RepID=F0ZGJ8_DICPU|nr:uncharacterized protein DICPUDRAFT_77419 [Dictyostelium purpureum]EGC36919.1 hypothetical protein DICPUDRAFT_77419 [Dictyostelium purpureum]|eukprot:XP_003286562.1 hypothetical protein DICPUDRAFT_77419 [Dictyostelium purpureum]